ncbi:MAG TPA: quinone-dependent dihydroorotate dehydrogenase [Candidatus Saccharimonadales bacterium]|jgi:dihydroorotate dehydrogenase (fumarate)|nr:quinone-dependent dihydroorotate dehydrogenase [Candidatus Saccharimonadales bacterium]
MNKLVYAVTDKTYRRLAKPLLFKYKPDPVHQHTLSLGSKLQRIEAIRHLLHGAWAYDNPAVLRQKIHGVIFRNPVGLSAGFDKNFEIPLLLSSIGFGFMEGGSLTFQPCSGNPRPWFHRLPNTQSIVVYAGLANEGVENIVQRLKQYPADTFRNFPLNISVARTNIPEVTSDKEAITDYVGSLKVIQAAAVGNLITLNISCPNTYGGEPFTTPGRLDNLLTQVDKLKITKPLFVKMPCDLPWGEFDKLLAVVAKHKITGVTISNLSKDRGQTKLMDPLPVSIKGNLSGKPTWELSNNLISKTYHKYHRRFTIIGVGGIFSAEDAYTKIKLGASLVELITGMIYEGPQLIGKINHDLVELLHRDGFSHVSQAIGVDSNSEI